MQGYMASIGFRVVLLVFIMLNDVAPQPHKHQRCSNRLENALEHMRRRSLQVKSARTLWDNPNSSPYQLYHSFYGQHSEPEEDYYNVGAGDGSFNDGRGFSAKNINRNGHHPHHGSSSFDLEDFLSSTTNANVRQPHKLAAISRVDVEDLKVRVPPGKSANRWVEIDKCKFSTENSTLDTRLIFPDLTLSGKVVLQPTGGKCSMILRLRHAGIEFRTIPIGFEMSAHEESRRLGAASVRTDSHFAEPGFISVFAHGCQGPSGIRLRQNLKRRFSHSGSSNSNPPAVALSEPHVILGVSSPKNSQRWGKFHNAADSYNEPIYDVRTESYIQRPPQRDFDLDFNSNEAVGSREFYDINGDNFYRRHFQRRRRRRNALDEHPQQRQQQQQQHHRQFQNDAAYENDEMNFNYDIFNFADDQLQQLVQPDARAFADIFSGGSGSSAGSGAGGGGSEDFVNDALSSELEKLFSMGVRGLLTTYMQRALQPAIKETLMENMGYTLSYG